MAFNTAGSMLSALKSRPYKASMRWRVLTQGVRAQGRSGFSTS